MVGDNDNPANNTIHRYAGYNNYNTTANGIDNIL